jgi:hypothetical protein
MPITLRIGFHRVVVNSRESMPFERILEMGQLLPDDETRTVSRPDGPIRLQFARPSANAWAGELMRIRLGEQAKKANINGHVEPIAFEDDEGLGEETAFLYDPELRIIVYHERKGGVSLTNAGRYFKAVGRVRSVEFQPVPKPELQERLRRMIVVREFIVHLAGVDNGRAYRGLGHSALALFGAANEFNATEAKFELSVGKGNSLQRAKETIAELMHPDNEARENVSKVILIGSESENDSQEEVINLIDDRLVVPVTMELKDGGLTNSHRHAAVFDAWITHRDSLAAYYARQTET